MLGCLFVRFGLIATTGEESCYRNIFVDFFPVYSQSTTADLVASALLWGGAEQARKLSEWNPNGTAIPQLDPHGVCVKV